MEQQGFITWFRGKYPGVLIFAIPNGGYRNITTAKTLRKEGVVPGVPDLFVPAWKLFIEMKKMKGGVVSQDQWKVILALKECGYTVIIGRGAEDASRKVLEGNYGR